MNPTAIYSKSGKGVQEAAGKTSLLSRPDRAVLSAIDGRATLADVAQRIGKPFDQIFEQVITKLDKDGFIREVSAGTAAPAGMASRPGVAAKGPAKPAAKAKAQVRPAWAELTAEQQQILAPLKADWESLEPERRRKWIGVAKRYPKMQPQAQERVQRRMQAWAKLTPEQRRQARETYKQIAKTPPEKRQNLREQWAEYQQLPPQERESLTAPGERRRR